MAICLKKLRLFFSWLWSVSRLFHQKPRKIWEKFNQIEVISNKGTYLVKQLVIINLTNCWKKVKISIGKTNICFIAMANMLIYFLHFHIFHIHNMNISYSVGFFPVFKSVMSMGVFILVWWDNKLMFTQQSFKHASWFMNYERLANRLFHLQ